MIRLDKYLADMGVGTRSEVKNIIRKGRVQMDNTVCKSPEQKVDPAINHISVDGHLLGYQKYYYYMLNKPAGVVSATEDKMDVTVIDVLRRQGLDCPVLDELFPVGRLDKDTEGLLLITNDGDLSHRLLAPGKHVDKMYYAKVDGEMTEDDINQFHAGIQLSDFTTMPAELIIERASDGTSEVRIRIQEGKFHQVKRMVHAVGKEVTYLKRLSMGSLQLDEKLETGSWRELTKEEILNLGGSLC